MRTSALALAIVLGLAATPAHAKGPASAPLNGAGFATATNPLHRAAALTKIGAQSLFMRLQTRFLRWTPTYKIALANGVTTTEQRPGLKQDQPRILKITNLGGESIANVYGAVPVSAHVMLKKYGSAPFSKVQGWSRTDKFQLELEDPSGQKTRILSDAQSTGLVTPIAFNLKLKPGQSTLTYWRNGSAGVAGARGSRTIILDYDGT